MHYLTEYSEIIWGPIYYQPEPFEKPALFNIETGELFIVRNGVTCQSKEGTVGDETMNCWYYINDIYGDPFQIVQNYTNVKTIAMPGFIPSDDTIALSDSSSNSIALQNSTTAINTRQLSELKAYQFDCILSQIFVSNAVFLPSVTVFSCQTIAHNIIVLSKDWESI